MTTMMGLAGTLAGIRVLDLSQGIAGPHCGCLLGDLGADVVKVEPPEGDWGRRLGAAPGEVGPTFHSFNRGKRSVVLDLRQESGREAARALAARAEVVIESNRPGVARRLGLDHATLSAGRPELIYVAVSGFGQDGPYAERPATDSIVQAFTGLPHGASTTGEPLRIRFGIVDVGAGVYASQAVLAALLLRARTGQGGLLDINLAHVSAALQAYKLAEAAGPAGSEPRELVAGIGTYATADGHLVVAGVQERHFGIVLDVVGRADLRSDPRFAEPGARLANQAALRGLIAVAIRRRPTAHWVAAMGAAGLPCQELLTYGRFREDPHVRAVNLVEDVAYEGQWPLPSVRCPGLSQTEFTAHAAPALGEHTREVLAEAGLGHLFDRPSQHHEELR